jgi:hypothetical protein
MQWRPTFRDCVSLRGTGRMRPSAGVRDRVERSVGTES